MYALFVDFARAFSSAPHDKLWNTLYALGVSSKIINVLQNLYSSARTVIRLHKGHSGPVDMTLGLLQGDSLSPLLFALYISDIEKILQESEADDIAITHKKAVHVLLFADDTVVLAPHVGALKKKIKVLECYFDSLGISVNIEKTKVVIFRKGGRVEKSICFEFKGNVIEIVPSYVYLGIIMLSSAIFRLQVEKAKVKAKQALQLDSDLPSLDYNWVTQVRLGLTTFGLGDLIGLNAEEFFNYRTAL